MRLGLTCDLQTDPADEAQAEFDPPATLAALRGALEALGHEVVPLGNAHELLREPRRLSGIELVFNIAEGAHGRCREAWVPTLLELSGVPYVGSDPLALMLGLDKTISKQLAQAAGLFTPRWISVTHPDGLPDKIPLEFPVIVKPRWEGSGRGIGPGAMVENVPALQARARWLYARCPEPMLIEEFIRGGELTVFVIGNHPPVALPAIQRPLDPVTGLAYHVVKPPPKDWIAPVTLDGWLDARAQAIARTMFEALGCRDMARVDLRVDPAGRLSFLEINPLPSFDPEGTVGLVAEHLGLSYAELIGRILEASLQRLRAVESVNP